MEFSSLVCQDESLLGKEWDPHTRVGDIGIEAVENLFISFKIYLLI